MNANIEERFDLIIVFHKTCKMIQKLNLLQQEIVSTEQWKEELPCQRKYGTTVCNPDKEMLLHREMARLRLKLKLAKATCRSKEVYVN